MKKINFKNKPNTDTPLSAENLNLLQQNLEDEFRDVGSIGVAKIKTLTGTCTGGNTTVQFPEGWASPAIISVEIRNANLVWINQPNIYASNSGLSFYFTHNEALNGYQYRVRILQTEKLGG